MTCNCTLPYEECCGRNQQTVPNPLRYGWACPVCKAVHSPDVDRCTKCADQDRWLKDA